MSAGMKNRDSPASADARSGSTWLFIHLANVLWWELIYLGSLAMAGMLVGAADLLRDGEGAEMAVGIDAILKLVDGWLTWGAFALVAYAVLGWPFVKREAPGVIAARARPVFLIFAFIRRRLGARRCRPARGTYWRHTFVRHRWLLLLIKIHFLPIAVGSLANTVTNLSRLIQRAADEPSLVLVLGFVLVAVRVIVDAVDAVVSSIAYSVESRRPGGMVRAVDINWAGWLSCLICYPPGWLLTSSLLAKRIEGETQLFSMESPLAYACAVLGVACYAIYGFSAINLGLRYSNLSYRGPTEWALYRWIRHPQYTSKIGG